jgi:hypothetical protein
VDDEDLYQANLTTPDDGEKAFDDPGMKPTNQLRASVLINNAAIALPEKDVDDIREVY